MYNNFLYVYFNLQGFTSLQTLDVPVKKVHKITKAKDVFRRPGSLKGATALLQRNVSLLFQNVTFY